MRRWLWVTVVLFVVGCSEETGGHRKGGPKGNAGGTGRSTMTAMDPSRAEARPSRKESTERRPRRREDLRDPVWRCEDGRCEWVERSECGEGWRIIDLSEQFVPFIFSSCTPGKDDCKENPYSKVYRNLSQDRTDEDGRRLGPHEHNYLELYGIPPTLGVLGERFVRSATGCATRQDLSIFEKDAGTLYYVGGKEARYRKAAFRLARKVRLPVTIALDDLEARMARAKGRRKARLRAFWKALVRYRQLLALQERLVCEEILKPGTFKPGLFDWATRRAVRRFERKHMVYGWGRVDRNLRKVLARSMLENDFAALRRVIRERVAHSVAILEDGSVKKWRDSHGSVHRVPDLVHSFRDIVMKAMGLTSPDRALAFFSEHPRKFFDNLRVCVKLPPLPEYYSDNMAFSVVIDRGDVWYDLPIDHEGHSRPQPVRRKPYLWLYVNHGGEKIPMVRLGTTIGGWMKEYAEGEVFLKYKESDVGPREWKYIVASPVWFPPKTTPPRELLRRVRRRGRWVWAIRRKQLGPSYASAYGLVMAIHTYERKEGGRVKDVDLGIRSHGSVNYMSILRSHSHGCHRLHNHLAVRLFSVILMRHPFERMGPQYKKWTHEFEYEDKKYRIELDFRGYYYKLTPPVPVMVTRGRIMGKRRTPIRDLVRIPGHEYPKDLTIGSVIMPDGSLKPYAELAAEATPTGEGTALEDTVPTAVPEGSADSTVVPAKTGVDTEIVPDGTNSEEKGSPVSGAKPSRTPKGPKRTDSMGAR